MKRKYYECLYCGWEWFSREPRLQGEEPKVCPTCHNDWRKKKIVTKMKGGKKQDEK